MSFQYDQYLAKHRANVKRGFDWLSENLPELMTNTLTAGWNTEFAHDQSKNEPDEYEAYDAYFYGNNRSYEVVQRYQRAWLLHIHRNPHHWQHWILIHDDMEHGELETVLEMPYDYIIEMICDWWSFSWQSGNLYEIFKWYEEHSKYIKLAQTTKITVEYILDNMKKKLQALQYADQSAIDFEIKGCPSKKDIWWQMIQLLPSSYNQTRNVMLNYEVLANIYRQRKNHKLDEWREICKWIETLPYSELITVDSREAIKEELRKEIMKVREIPAPWEPYDTDEYAKTYPDQLITIAEMEADARRAIKEE